MKASIDTDVVIHLYLSNKQGLFFNVFDGLYMHEFLYEKELKRKSLFVYEKFSLDVVEGKATIIRNKDLVEMGVKGLFEDYKRDFEYLFDSGELYAVSLAKAMGLFAFVSDDTKEFGPHETLLKELIEDVIPFAFYELLFLRYLSGEFTVEEIHQEFDEVTSKSMRQRPMKFRSRMLKTVRRFSYRNGTQRDYDWINAYCKKNNIHYKNKMIGLKEYLSQIE
jgi:hypothetical protein